MMILICFQRHYNFIQSASADDIYFDCDSRIKDWVSYFHSPRLFSLDVTKNIMTYQQVPIFRFTAFIVVHNKAIPESESQEFWFNIDCLDRDLRIVYNKQIVLDSKGTCRLWLTGVWIVFCSWLVVSFAFIETFVN